MRLHYAYLYILLVIFCLNCTPVTSFVPSRLLGHQRRANILLRCASTNSNTGDSNESCCVFFDLTVQDESAGRLVFRIPQPNHLPIHTENIIKLISKTQTSIDPRCSYIKCPFSHSPQFVEGLPQYRWAHTLKGKGKNAVGRADEMIREADGTLQQCTHSIYGGVYYGLNYKEVQALQAASSEIVLLTVALSGPGRGSTGLSLVRVSESPQEWQERLLLNSAVLGWMEGTSSVETLHRVARQTQGPPVVVDTGILLTE